MSAHFVKLYGSILDSTVWLEKSGTRILWITMLAMADDGGFVMASVPGLAKRAGITRKECEAGLTVLLAPDRDSRTPDHQGRRLEKIEGGWLILNHRKYRDLRTDAQIATAERVRKHREKHRAGVTVTDVTGGNAPKRTEVEGTEVTEPTEKTTTPAVADIATSARAPQNGKADFASEFVEWWPLYPKRALGNSKANARKAFVARRREGVSRETLFEGVQRYAACMAATGKIGSEFVMQARTFLGCGEHYLETYELPATNGHGDARTETATAIWKLIRACGVLHRTTQRERDNDVDTLVADGRLQDDQVPPFKTILKTLDFNLLKTAQKESFAVRHIADRLNGSTLRLS